MVTCVTARSTVRVAMKTVTIRDFRTRPRQVRDALRQSGDAVLTANGRPVAVLVPTDAATLDNTPDLLRRARGLEALRAIGQASRSRGLDRRFSPRDIDAVIAKVRRMRAVSSDASRPGHQRARRRPAIGHWSTPMDRRGSVIG